MPKITIVGSGPAAAAAVVALLAEHRYEIEILDLGERLEASQAELLAEVKGQLPYQWAPDVRARLSRQPAPRSPGELPQKWMFGSDFPFRSVGQLDSITVQSGGNALSVSGAFGGFSNAWGAQIMPFTRRTLDEWPVGYEQFLPHYRAVLQHVPLAGTNDDYAELFPLLSKPVPLPPLAPTSKRVLSRYVNRRPLINRLGVTAGEARLAMRANDCVACGLCLTGCPYHLIYSSAQTLQPLIEQRRVRYRDRLRVIRVGEDSDGCWLEVNDLRDGVTRKLRSDKVLLACGAIGTTRVVLNSIRPETRRVGLQESVQLVLPFVSRYRHPDPRDYGTFTLNQFNLLIRYGRAELDLAQFHLYPYNPAFDAALPRAVARSPASASAALRRTTAGLGYLPSWASPTVELAIRKSAAGVLPGVAISRGPNAETRRALVKVMARLVAVAPVLDLWPVIPSLRVSGAAKSYHFGGSFPHVSGRPAAGSLATDELGRPAEWSNTHLIDASVFPTVAATTFTLTVMANAHRIANEIARGGR